MSLTHTGSCHCGAIGVTLTSSFAIEHFVPRACGCTFCRKHPALWFADPAGQLAMQFDNPPNRYRFGTKTADFVLCPICGVIVGATCAIDGRDFGILNLNCLDGERDWPKPASLSDFDGEGTGDRLQRRANNWMPLVGEGDA